MPNLAEKIPNDGHNKSGQSMRRKGHDKYQRLVQATAEILRTRSIAELKAADVARAAGTSAPNFYLYFDNVLDAVLAAVRQVSMANPGILSLLRERWPDTDVEPDARRFVEAYLAHWQSQATLLRARSALVAQGDSRFREAELQASADVVVALSRQFASRARAASEYPSARERARAGIVLAMLDRLAGYLPGMSPQVLSDEELIDTASEMLAVAIRHARSL